MVALNLTLSDDECERVASAARREGVEVEDFVRGMMLHGVAVADGRRRFDAAASQGDTAAGMAILERIDQRFGPNPRRNATKP